MEKATSVIAALQAGKLPTQKQINQFIDFVSNTVIPQITPNSTDSGLSEHGVILADAIRNLLLSYAQFGTAKNQDNLIQQILYHLSQADITDTSVDVDMDTDAAKADLRAIRESLSTILSIVWQSISSEGIPLFEDFASFARLALADAAESLESGAASVKDGLREIDDEVQKGERTTVGRKKLQEGERDDAQASFERGMDEVKGAGSSVIGAGQAATEKVQDLSQRTSDRLSDTWNQICDRAQTDAKYKRSVNKVFGIIHKWFNHDLDNAPSQPPTLSSLIDDPTEEQHVQKSLDLLGTLVERLTNTSLTPLFDKLRVCALDVRADKDLRVWFNEYLDYMRKCLNEPDYRKSQQAKSQRGELRNRWNKLKNGESDNSKRWKKDIDALKKEADNISKSVDNDEALQKVRKAHDQLGAALAGTAGQAAQEMNWFWQDMLKVYVPRTLDALKDVPIPRMEYKDESIEFVLENLDISSFNLLPSHIFIRNITDVAIDASKEGSNTAVGTLTHIRVQALQLQLNDLSFWYRDKEATIGPEVVSGLLGFTLPEKGIDLDLKVRLIPSTKAGLEERRRKRRFNVIELLEVNVSPESELQIRESNHGILLSVFKPVFTMRVREALEAALAEQIRAALDWSDHFLWDLSDRKEVVRDMGVSEGAAWAGALWSEIGKLRRQDDQGLGVSTTSTGLVVEQAEAHKSFAIGVEPQILSGDKRGPMGTGSRPLDEVIQENLPEGAEIAEGAEGAKEGAEQAIRQGKRVVGSFKKKVDAKREQEKESEGWESGSFDL